MPSSQLLPPSSIRAVVRWARTSSSWRCFHPRAPGHQLPAGDGELEQLGGRRQRVGLGHAHHRAPLEVVEVGRTDARGEVGLAERLLALGVAALVGVEHLGRRLRPAQHRVPGEAEQIEGPRQGVDNPAVVVGVGQPLHRQPVPEEVLEPLLGEHLEALAGGHPVQRCLGCLGGAGVLCPELGDGVGDHGVLVVGHAEQSPSLRRPSDRLVGAR